MSTPALLLINTLVFLVALAGCLLIGGLYLNQPPIQEPPGFWPRLNVYLTTNVAETRLNHPFPELELRRYTLAPAHLFAKVEQALTSLGWEVVERDPLTYQLRAVIETPLMRFRDDFTVKIIPNGQGSELHLRSQSRVGRGDLAANTRHIMLLYAALAHQA